MPSKLAALLTATGLALALAPVATLPMAAPAAAQTAVSNVEVEMNLAAIKNAKAAAVWTNAPADLQNAIVARIADRADKDGVKIRVRLDEVALSNSYEQAMNIADTKLAGRVNISSTSDNSKFDTYDLAVSFDASYLPTGTDMTAINIESPVYYQAMINLFADRVVEKLK